MATDINTQTNLEAFHNFVGELLKQGKKKLTIKEALAAYEEYLTELERLREELQPSLERASREEGSNVDPGEIKRRGREHLSQESITD